MNIIITSIIIVTSLLIFSISINIILPEDVLQFIEKLPYYIVLLTFITLFFYISLQRNGSDNIIKDSSDNEDFNSDTNNFQMFYMFIFSMYMLIIYLFIYLFHGIRWLIFALFQKKEELANEGNINKEIFNNNIKKHAIKIYKILYICIYIILKTFNINLGSSSIGLGTPDYPE